MKRLLLASLSVIAVTTVCHADLAAASANAVPGHYLDLKCTVDTARRVIVLPAVEGGADVAVAMLDRRITTPDTLTTIASQLLLQSDLRGHIEDAAWYLRAPAQETIPAADALMLTQGWTRYDIPAVISGTINDSLPYPLEIGAQLDGVIRSKWRGKPLAGVTANVLAPRMADGASAVTDSLGRFHITGLEWPDSTYFVISAMNAKGKLEENIHPDFDDFPSIASLPSHYLPSLPDNNSADDDDWQEYIARLNSSPQGMQVTLREVTVRATKQRKGDNAIDILASVFIRPGEDEYIRTYEDAVAHVPGVNVINDGIMFHQTPVAVWVDGRYFGCAPPEMNRMRNQNISLGVRNINRKALQSIGYGVMPVDSEDTSKYYKKTDSNYDVGLYTNQLTLSDLESMYPFKDNKSVSYVPPHFSMFFQRGAINDRDILSRTNGGILNIVTKKPGEFKNVLSSEFQIVMPLGYQKPRKFYVPKYTPEGIAEDQTGAALRWLPSVDLSRSVELPIPPNMVQHDVLLSIEGITQDGKIINFYFSEE